MADDRIREGLPPPSVSSNKKEFNWSVVVWFLGVLTACALLIWIVVTLANRQVSLPIPKENAIPKGANTEMEREKRYLDSASNFLVEAKTIVVLGDGGNFADEEKAIVKLARLYAEIPVVPKKFQGQKTKHGHLLGEAMERCFESVRGGVTMLITEREQKDVAIRLKMINRTQTQFRVAFVEIESARELVDELAR
jgi:hypothetical protein